MPESGTAHPLRLQPPYGGVSPTAEGLQMGCRVEVALVLEKAGVVCRVKPGAGLGTVNP